MTSEQEVHWHACRAAWLSVDSLGLAAVTKIRAERFIHVYYIALEMAVSFQTEISAKQIELILHLEQISMVAAGHMLMRFLLQLCGVCLNIWLPEHLEYVWF